MPRLARSIPPDYGDPKLTFCPSLRRIEAQPLFILRASMTNLEPTMKPNIERPKAGFTSYAERLNGRAAMVGFVAVIAIEYFTGQGVLSWLGLV